MNDVKQVVRSAARLPTTRWPTDNALVSSPPVARSPMFLSLRHRNARFFFAGLLVSNVGSWIQLTAMALLVYRLTGRSLDVGITVACQYLPVLLLGAWGGAIADRSNKRRMAALTQSLLAVQALVLGALTLAGLANLTVVYGMSLIVGVANAFDNPARRGLLVELVEPSEIPNAMSLNTATTTGSRIFGPALAGLLVNSIGAGWCFLINGATFAVVLFSMAALDTDRMYRSKPAARGGTPVRDALRFVLAGDRRLMVTFVVLTVVSTFGFTYTVSLPKLADVRYGDAAYYGLLLSTMSVGNLAGSLLTASRSTVSMRWFLASTLLFGCCGIAVAWAPNIAAATIVAIPFGLGGAGFVASANAIAQQRCPPDMRGRVLSLTAVAFLGSTPIGGPITGLIGDHVSPEWGAGYGGVITILTVIAVTVAVLGPMRILAPTPTP